MNYLSQNNPENHSKGILTYDGVHLNHNGNQFIADEMIKFLKLEVVTKSSTISELESYEIHKVGWCLVLYDNKIWINVLY